MDAMSESTPSDERPANRQESGRLYLSLFRETRERYLQQTESDKRAAAEAFLDEHERIIYFMYDLDPEASD